MAFPIAQPCSNEKQTVTLHELGNSSSLMDPMLLPTGPNKSLTLKNEVPSETSGDSPTVRRHLPPEPPMSMMAPETSAGTRSGKLMVDSSNCANLPFIENCTISGDPLAVAKLGCEEQQTKEPSHDRVTDTAATRTPSQKRHFTEIPASTDSSQDDMSLAEMKDLINRLGCQQARDSNATIPPPERNLAVASKIMIAQDHTMSNIENSIPYPQVGGDITKTGARKVESVAQFIQVATASSGIMSSSLNRCVPLPTTDFSVATFAEAEKTAIPDLSQLMNFPPKFTVSKHSSTRSCFMCGSLRTCYGTRKEGKQSAAVFMHAASKGICTSCEIAGWEVVESKLQLKWCRQCDRFCTLSSFLAKRARANVRLLGTCAPCRDRDNTNRARSRKREKDARILKESDAANKQNVKLSTGASSPSLKRLKLMEQSHVTRGVELSAAASTALVQAKPLSVVSVVAKEEGNTSAANFVDMTI